MGDFVFKLTFQGRRLEESSKAWRVPSCHPQKLLLCPNGASTTEPTRASNDRQVRAIVRRRRVHATLAAGSHRWVASLKRWPVEHVPQVGGRPPDAHLKKQVQALARFAKKSSDVEGFVAQRAAAVAALQVAPAGGGGRGAAFGGGLRGGGRGGGGEGRGGGGEGRGGGGRLGGGEVGGGEGEGGRAGPDSSCTRPARAPVKPAL